MTVAVSSEFGGKGIATNLSKIVVQEAKKAGFKYLFSEATGQGSLKAMKKVGFTEDSTIKYADWVHGKGCMSKGTQPLTKVEAPHECITLLTMMLDK